MLFFERKSISYITSEYFWLLFAHIDQLSILYMEFEIQVLVISVHLNIPIGCLCFSVCVTRHAVYTVLTPDIQDNTDVLSLAFCSHGQWYMTNSTSTNKWNHSSIDGMTQICISPSGIFHIRAVHDFYFFVKIYIWGNIGAKLTCWVIHAFLYRSLLINRMIQLNLN